MKNIGNKTLDFLINVDRRIVYVALFLSIALPFFLTPVLKLKTTKWVEASFQQIELAAKNNKPILIGFDYDASLTAELQPMARAILRHAFDRNVKVVGINFIANGTTIGAAILDDIAKEYGKVYGIDYVYLGYQTQYNVVLLNIGNDLRKSYNKDFRNSPIDAIPLLKGIQNYDNFQCVYSLAGSSLPLQYIIYGVDRFKFNFVGGTTAVSATEYYAYLQSGQMKGLIAGMKSAAEYETLLKKPGDGMRGMASQVWGHLTIIGFIVLGNILFFIKRKRDGV